MERKPKILVIGSLVMDQIVITKEIPQEGRRVFAEDFVKTPGGKGANQAVQAARLGADVTLIGKVGRDINGEELLQACQEEGVDTSKMLYDEDGASGCAVIILEKVPGERRRNRIFVISGSNMKIRPEEVEFLKEDISRYDMVMLQNEIPLEVNETAVRFACEKGVPVMLKPAPVIRRLPREFIRHLTYIAPNEQELRAMTGVIINRKRGIFNYEEAKVASAIMRSKGYANILTTLGESGALLDATDKTIYKKAAPNTEVVDPTAGSDSFLGAFCTRICMGDSRGQALTFANYAAAITISRMGVLSSLPTTEEVVKLLEANGRSYF
ncbi:MAG TPA: ribokinase [Candidatus Anaerostipes avistercoris]|uniref:Ribokinase n=1 Tax=Candidatus Anaerostipes avistercoris TaxID=2838462 RepID=A0A9D2PIH0_9FIRM|nr:ribokinase [uncultured Anaerostipes sp.]HJC50854.1 ribokinase [Candidatus Anaerostipes avistercoris]